MTDLPRARITMWLDPCDDAGKTSYGSKLSNKQWCNAECDARNRREPWRKAEWVWDKAHALIAIYECYIPAPKGASAYTITKRERVSK
jgi:hypothetical protein